MELKQRERCPNPLRRREILNTAKTSLLLLCVSTLFATQKLQAQPIPATLPETVVAPLTLIYPRFQGVVVNCDMFEVTDRMNIKAIAWDNGSRKSYSPTAVLPQAWFYVEDGAGHSHIVTLPQNSGEPDIVIADDGQAPGQNYLVGVVYTRASNPYANPMLGNSYFDVYRLTNVGSPAFTVSLVTTVPLGSGNLTNLQLRDGNPHIDMWTEPTSLINGRPMLKQFAIVFSEAYNLNARYGDINSPLAATSFSLGACGGMADVACLTDLSTGEHEMEIVYGSALTGGNLRITEYNTATSSSATTILDPSSPLMPRVEAMSLYKPNPDGNLKWYAAAVEPGPFLGATYGYSNLNIGSPDYLSNDPVYQMLDCKSPAVAAGIGSFFPSNIGNKQYTTGFLPLEYTNPPTNPYTDIISRSVDAFTGTVSTEYQVNTTPVICDWDVNRVYAVSNCSNTGKDILSAYYNGSRIVYKVSPNSMMYKTTGIESTVPEVSPVRLFPNPAGTEVSITGAEGYRYEILSLSGKLLLTGTVSSGPIDIHNLPTGMYAVRLISKTNSIATLKLTKQ